MPQAGTHLAHNPYSQSIAEALGISRQAVHQEGATHAVLGLMVLVPIQVLMVLVPTQVLACIGLDRRTTSCCMQGVRERCSRGTGGPGAGELLGTGAHA